MYHGYMVYSTKMGFLGSLQGNFHQGDLRFQGGNQCTAMALIALLFAGFNISPTGWEANHINDILLQGDTLYHSISNSLYPNEESVLLFHNDLPSMVELFDRTFHINLSETFYGGVQTAVLTEANGYSLDNALEQGFAISDFALATFGQSTVALFRQGPDIWVFDSHARDFRGRVDGDGAAVLWHFSNINSLHVYLCSMYTGMVFNVTPLKIHEVHSKTETMNSKMEQNGATKNTNHNFLSSYPNVHEGSSYSNIDHGAHDVCPDKVVLSDCASVSDNHKPVIVNTADNGRQSCSLGFLGSVQGNFHQGDLRFQGGNQCTAMALIALLFAGFHISPTEWEANQINDILLQGDTLYHSISNSLYPNDESVLLFHNDLPSMVELFDQTFHINLSETFYGGVQTAVLTEANGYSLDNALEQGFTISDFALATFGQSTVALFRQGSDIWVFDSHARDFRGRVDGDGAAVLLHFSNINSLHVYLSSMYTGMVFNLTPLKINEVHSNTEAMNSKIKQSGSMKNTNQDFLSSCPNLHEDSSYSNIDHGAQDVCLDKVVLSDGASVSDNHKPVIVNTADNARQNCSLGFLGSVQGNFHQGDLRFQGGNQCTAMALIALLFAGFHISPTEWEANQINDILLQGDTLYHSISNSLYPNDESVLLFHNDLPSMVELLDQIFHINLSETFYGGVQTAVLTEANGYSLYNALEQGFTISDFALATFGQSTVALFRQGPDIWVFDSHARDFRGRVDGDGAAVLLHFSNINSLYVYLSFMYTGMVFNLTPLKINEVHSNIEAMNSKIKQSGSMKNTNHDFLSSCPNLHEDSDSSYSNIDHGAQDVCPDKVVLSDGASVSDNHKQVIVNTADNARQSCSLGFLQQL